MTVRPKRVGMGMLLLLSGILIPFSLLHAQPTLHAQRPEQSRQLTFVELNCENLFDYHDDPLKEDDDFTPEGVRRWTKTRYWRKLNHTGQTILSCSESIPELVALIEVESDTVLHDLTRRSLLRNAGYEYFMTSSPDVRGINVALLYQPSSFQPVCYDTFTVQPVKGMRPTRDILYVKGLLPSCDTLHVFVVHSPSRYGGKRFSRPSRMQVVRQLGVLMDSLYQTAPMAQILVAGDFNDPAKSPSVKQLTRHGLHCVTSTVKGLYGSRAGYRYHGEWEQIDHLMVSPSFEKRLTDCHINDAPFLMEEDREFGGKKPFRTYIGYRYQPGFSDHLPIVMKFLLQNR